MTAIVSPPPDAVIVAAPAPLRIRVQIADPANYSRAHREPKLIVLHATCGGEGKRAGENAAAEIAVPLARGKRKSWHYVVDAAACTRCVPDLLTAWHAGPHANARSIGIELCGRADQTRAQWLDVASRATLSIAARLVADLCREYHLPILVVDPAGLRAGRHGITTHAFVSEAWRESNHTDPGPGFPLVEFVAAVERGAVEAMKCPG